jgi:secondary thiamine-phosphate synthase enzyme
MKRFIIDVETDGNTDIINLSPDVARHVRDVPGEALVHLFIGGSTAGLTTLEFEPGLVRHDMPNLFQRLIPDDATYEHERTWHDDNGHSHARSSLVGTELTVPISNGRLMTGEYQQIVLIDFDTQPRKRRVVGTILE